MLGADTRIEQIAENKMKMEIECAEFVVPVKYYRGWTVEFKIKTERFNCPLLCLFGFLSIPDLEKAIDFALEIRNKG